MVGDISALGANRNLETYFAPQRTWMGFPLVGTSAGRSMLRPYKPYNCYFFFPVKGGTVMA